MQKFNEKNLDYFGENYELKVINQLIGTKDIKSKGVYRREAKWGRKVLPVLKQDHFTHPLAKRIVVFLKNYFNKNNNVPYYDTIKEYIKAKVYDELEQEKIFTYLKDIESIDIEDDQWIQENTLNFINTKNLYLTFKKIENEYINRGKYSQFNEIADMVSSAIVELKDDDRLEAFVPGDYRDLENVRGVIIPTGLKKLDKDMAGGLGIGELAIVVAGLKVGKAQPNFCKVYTPDGYKLMGEICVGDKVMGSDGKSQEVLGVYPQGKIGYYKVTFSDNTSTYCSRDHLWNVKKSNDLNYETLDLNDIIKRFNNGESLEIPTLDFSLLSKAIFGKSLDLMNPDKRKYFKSIDYIGETQCTCIKVSNDDSLYVTDDFILTHNTTFATYIANNAAQSGFNVLQIFIEDTEEQIKLKHRSKLTGFSLSNVAAGKNKEAVRNKSDVLLKKIKKAGGCLVPLKMDSLNTTVDDIARVIKKAEERGVWFADEQCFKKLKFDVVLIDYVDCIKPKGKYKDSWGGDAEIMRGLENLCSRKHGLGFACWAFTQGGRSSLNSNLVAEGDVGGSIKKLQIAHFIASISKTQEQRPEGKGTFAILGSRIGRDGIIYKDCTFDNGRMHISFDDVDNIANYVKEKEFEETINT